MKITTQEVLPGNQAQKATQREKVSRPFEQVLTNIENKATISTDKTSPTRPAFQATPVFLDDTGTEEVLQNLDGSLCMLESYQSRLGNVSVPVHELQADIDRLQREANYLQSKLDRLSNDHPVRNLLNRSLVAMTVEIEKYRRGDFR